MSLLSERIPQGMQGALQPEENAPGRAAEAVLLVVALVLGLGGLAMVGYTIEGKLPDSFWMNTLVLTGLSLVAHIVLRIRAPYADQVILPAVVLLSVMSLAMITRLQLEGMRLTDAPRHLMWNVVGIVVMCVILVLLRDHRLLRKFTYTAMLAALVLVILPLIPGLGKELNGARIWISVAGFSLQPAEFAKLLFAVFFAGYLVANRDTLALAGKKVLGLQLPRMRDLGPILVVWAVSLTVLVGQKDLGTSLLFFGLFVGMLYLATERGGWVAIGLSMFVIGAFVAWTIFGHVQARVDIWLNPLDQELYERDPGGSFQIVQGMFGMAYGGLFGAGWGEGFSTRIPFAFSDMIYATFGEELGLTGLLGILLVYLVIVQRGMRTAVGVRDGFGKLLAGGLAFVMALQVFVVVGGITQVIPLTGLTLPFMAQGGSSMVANWVVVALLLRISDAARRPSALPTRGQVADVPASTQHPGVEGAIPVGPGASPANREAARQNMPAPSDEKTQMHAPIRDQGGDQA
ncbi:FtsW/RodA/SpoVE family cell cycle protein [Myceligenerans crystallogenes]|uniref:FtsW/RodA/SpoVE family cell cycle protein n=1 Tax=Myceligenerans crystallogenes TaxID=316335 RepID=A0ABP4ZQ57_9MICO